MKPFTKQFAHRWREQGRTYILIALALFGLAWLLLHKLPTLVGGLSYDEAQTATAAVGWHGIYNNPFNLPLQLVRSVVFSLAPDHGQLLTRLPNALFGALAIISFAWLIWLWHGTRTMVLATLLFATSAWTLHVSRLASFDVIYLWAAPTLLLVQLRLQQGSNRWIDWYGSLLVLGLLLYVPGMIWLVLLSAYLQRKALLRGWQYFATWWQRALSVSAVVIWLPLLLVGLTRPGQFVQWIGLPTQFGSILDVFERFGNVFIHLFVIGPRNPALWLERAPLFDIFTLAMAIVGIYFYARHWRSKRSCMLAAISGVGILLIGLGGPVGLSLLVPVMYMSAATGITYILHDWLKTFPLNPLARGLGMGIVVAAVAISCIYNLRSYYIAWPHNPITEATFHYHR